MENTARAILKINDNYIFIKRENKPNCEYDVFYSFAGGHLEKGESYEDACIREIKEELGIDIKVKKLYFEIQNIKLNKHEKFFIVEYISGKLGTGKGEEFVSRDQKKYGSYEIVKVNENELKSVNILPTELKLKLINDINNNKK